LIDQLAEENGLTQEEYQSILNSFLSEPAKSLYGVVNAVSNSAQMCPDADRRFEIEAIAGGALNKYLTV
jgi:hypothetical protein